MAKPRTGSTQIVRSDYADAAAHRTFANDGPNYLRSEPATLNRSGLACGAEEHSIHFSAKVSFNTMFRSSFANSRELASRASILPVRPTFVAAKSEYSPTFAPISRKFIPRRRVSSRNRNSFGSNVPVPKMAQNVSSSDATLSRSHRTTKVRRVFEPYPRPFYARDTQRHGRRRLVSYME